MIVMDGLTVSMNLIYMWKRFITMPQLIAWMNCEHDSYELCTAVE